MHLVGVVREEQHGIQRIRQRQDAESEPALRLVRLARVKERSGGVDREVLGSLEGTVQRRHENRMIWIGHAYDLQAGVRST